MPDTCSPWATLADVTCGPCATYDAVDEATLELGIDRAGDVLFHLSGRRYPGVCTDTILPNTCSPCSCCGHSAVRLSGYPVVEVTEVSIDGAVVDPARYRVHNQRSLVYLPADGDPRRGWPTIQRLNRPLGEPGTWSVTYTYGRMPPEGGVAAAVSLGCAMALACVGDADACNHLAEAVANYARQGVSIDVDDVGTLAEGGLTGDPTADQWLRSLRHGDRYRRATVASVGGPSRRHTRLA